jgi:addiction module HigA family antidote
MAKQKITAPCDILKNLLEEYQISANKAASDLQLSSSLIRQVLSGTTKISLQVAIRLAKYFNLTPEYWLNLQTQYDLAEIKADAEMTKILNSIQKAKLPKAGPKKAAEPQKSSKPSVKKADQPRKKVAKK